MPGLFQLVIVFCKWHLTYHESNTLDIDWMAPLDAQNRFGSSVHNGHDIISVRTETKPRFSKIGEEKRSDLGLHEAGRIGGSIWELLAGHRT